MEELLTKEEVDALLLGLNDEPPEDNGKITWKQGNKGNEKDVVYEYDFNCKLIRGRMPTLEIMAEKISVELKREIFNLCRHTTEVGVVGVHVVRYTEYLRNQFLPTSLNICNHSDLDHQMLISFDPKLVFSVTDYMFGGLGKFAFRIEGREFTLVENEVIDRLVKIVKSSLEKEWDLVFDTEAIITPDRKEVNPQFATIVGPSDDVVVVEMSIDIEGVGGECHLVIPYNSIIKYKDVLEMGITYESVIDKKLNNIINDTAEDIEV